MATTAVGDGGDAERHTADSTASIRRPNVHSPAPTAVKSAKPLDLLRRTVVRQPVRQPARVADARDDGRRLRAAR